MATNTIEQAYQRERAKNELLQRVIIRIGQESRRKFRILTDDVRSMHGTAVAGMVDIYLADLIGVVKEEESLAGLEVNEHHARSVG